MKTPIGTPLPKENEKRDGGKPSLLVLSGTQVQLHIKGILGILIGHDHVFHQFPLGVIGPAADGEHRPAFGDL